MAVDQISKLNISNIKSWLHALRLDFDFDCDSSPTRQRFDSESNSTRIDPTTTPKTTRSKSTHQTFVILFVYLLHAGGQLLSLEFVANGSLDAIRLLSRLTFSCSRIYICWLVKHGGNENANLDKKLLAEKNCSTYVSTYIKTGLNTNVSTTTYGRCLF